MAVEGATTPARAGSPGTRERGFYVVMAVLIALVVAAGFGPSYAASLPPPGLPLWVHLHGAVMLCWIMLFAVQAWLGNRRSLALHRRLGWLSTGLVAAMVPLGLATNLLAVRRGATPPFFTPAQMIAADFIDLLLFAGLFIAAIALRRRPDWHKRLMLSATVLLTWPALGRLGPLHGFGLAMIIPLATALLIALALVGPGYDLASRRRVHRAYIWAVSLIVLAQPLHLLLAESAPLQSLADALAA